MSDTPTKQDTTTPQKGTPSPDNAKHFPNTVKLLQRRSSESPQRQLYASDDDEKDVLLMATMESSPNRAQSRAAAGGDDSQLRERLRLKLQLAAERREALLVSRKRHLEELEHQRQAKVKQTKELRRRAVVRFVNDAPALLLQFDHAGLHVRPKHVLNTDVIEQTLVTDPIVCEHCAGKPSIHQRICPVTQKPHRRMLILTAERLLKLIGDTRVNLLAPSTTVSDTTVAAPKAKTRRGISINPQLFVLAFYNAAISEGDPEGDPLVRDCARHLLEVVENIKVALGQPHDLLSEDEAYVNRLLYSFAKAWRQYIKVSGSIIGTSPDGRKAAEDELLKATNEAVISAKNRIIEMKLRGDENGAASEADLLEQYIKILETRAQRIGGETAVETLRATIKELDESALKEHASKDSPTPPTSPLRKPPVSPDLSPANTPEHRPSKANVVVPPAPLPRSATNRSHSVGTSGSETDGGPSRVYGPPLPPNWRVNEHGTSVPPPPPTEEELKKEKFQRLEYRASQAYRAKVRPPQYEAPEAKAVAELKAQLDDSMWAQFSAELSQSPPNLERIPLLFDKVTDALVEALPKKLRGRTSQEMRDVLDWSVVRHRVRAGQGEEACGDLTKYVVNKVCEFGAPAREGELRSRTDAVLKHVIEGEPTHLVVVDMFRLMLESIEQLRKDIASFSMVTISDELVNRCVEFQRSFVDECLPPPTEWDATIKFLKAGRTAFTKYNEAVSASTPGTPGAPIPLPTVNNDQLQSSLYFGAVELMKSSQLDADSRWSLFAKESLHFDKATIFEVANAVQMCTLRLMLTGTLSLVLQPFRQPHTVVTPFMTFVDKKLREEWLNPKNSLSLENLKAAVVEETHHFLNSLPSSPQDSPHGAVRSLSTTDINVLHAVIDKMTDTGSMQYSTFEQRVTNCILHHLILGDGPQSAVIRPIGLVTDEVKRCAKELRRVLQHNWEVHQPYYEQLRATVL